MWNFSLLANNLKMDSATFGGVLDGVEEFLRGYVAAVFIYANIGAVTDSQRRLCGCKEVETLQQG